jgi:hypothetical protein
MSVSPNHNRECKNPWCTNGEDPNADALEDNHVLFGCDVCSQLFCMNCLVLDYGEVMCRYCRLHSDAIRDQPSDNNLSDGDQPDDPFAHYYASEDYMAQHDPNDPSPSIEDAAESPDFEDDDRNYDYPPPEDQSPDYPPPSY